MIISFNALLRQGVALCLIATPLCALLYDPNVIFPFISPKAITFHALVLIELIMSSILLLTATEFKKDLIALSQSKIFKSCLTYFLFVAISCVLAENSLRALWGSPERADGVYLKVFCIYSMVMGALFLHRHDWKILFLVIIFTGVIMFFFQWSQYIRNINRPGSLLNQPTFLASFYLYAIGSCLVLNSLCEKLKFRPFINFFTVVTIIIFLIGIYISGTRSSLLAALISFFGIFIWPPNGLITSRSKKIVFLLAPLVLFIFILNLTADGTDAVSRMVNVSKNYASVASRTINIEISLSSMNPFLSGFKSFLFGWGWNNYYLAWDAAYLPSISKFDPAPFDKSHNTYLDIVVMTGVLGFAFFIFYLNALLSGVQNIKSKETKIALTFLLNAILIQYLFTFESFMDVVMFNIFVTFLLFTEIKERLN